MNDAEWQARKPRPDYSFVDFATQLKGSDAIVDIVGASGVVYTNSVWNATEPTGSKDVGVYANEIWIDAASIDGPRAGNYTIEIIPGTLTVIYPKAVLQTTIASTLNWNTGLLDLTLTVKNIGEGEVDPDYGFWVELKPGEAGKGSIASVEKTYYIASPTGTMPDGYDYLDLTAQVKAQLKATGNNDEVFDPGESISVGVSVFHWKRWKPEKFITNPNEFFVAGKLFNEADSNMDFSISEEEKIAAGPLLGTDSSAYCEVTRLSCLEFYHWNSGDETWK